MRIVRLTLNGPGFTAPIPVNYMQPNFNVAVGVIPSAGATGLSCSAQYTMDDQIIKRQAFWSQVAQVVTIKDGIQPFGRGASSLPTQLNPHGMITGDTVSIEGTGSAALAGGAGVGFDGNYAVTVVDANTYTITVTPSQTASGDCRIIPQRWVTSAQVPAATATRLYTNILQPISAIRFNVAALTTPSVDFLVIQGLD